MRKWWTLTGVFMKTIIGSSMSIKIKGKENKWAGMAVWLIAALCFFPIMFAIYHTMGQIFSLFYVIGQLPVAVGLALNIGSIIIFVFSFMAAPALFYFAKDVEFLLPLPARPQQVIGAKFAVALAFEYIVALGLMVVMFAALRSYVPLGVLSFSTVITFITLPILPMVYSTVLVMLLMRVTRLGRNPDRYTLIVGILAIAIAVGFSMYSNQAFAIDQELLLDAVMGEPVALTTLNTLFIGNGFAAQAFGATAIFGGALHNQLINIAVAVVAVVIFFWLAGRLYFAGVIGLSESGAPTKKMTVEDIAASSQGRGKFYSYLVKELKLVFRSPTVFMNCVLVAFIMPIILLASLVPLMRSGEFDELLYLINFSNPRVSAMVMVIMCAVGFFVGGMITVAGTAISREGRNIFIMKYLPVPYPTQLNAKAVSGIVLLVPALLFIVVPLQVVFAAPLWLFVTGTLVAVPGMLFVNYLGLYIDLVRPKLTWDNEQAAVKQNLNIIILMFGSWGVAAGIGMLGWFMTSFAGPLVAFLGLFGITGLLAVLAYYLAVGKGGALMEKLH
ncbi:MAG: hypothetical protein FWC92_03855 [Defluviitaleaceae bacterium]|nr:hypothetical protein [Defluviitaleaceae bacterium]